MKAAGDPLILTHHPQVVRPMVHIARQVIEENGYTDVIRVIPKRSTDMTEADMEGGRANILVTEVFDTELIGEGALVTFAHAHKHLLAVSGEREFDICCSNHFLITGQKM